MTKETRIHQSLLFMLYGSALGVSTVGLATPPFSPGERFVSFFFALMVTSCVAYFSLKAAQTLTENRLVLPPLMAWLGVGCLAALLQKYSYGEYIPFLMGSLMGLALQSLYQALPKQT